MISPTGSSFLQRVYTAEPRNIFSVTVTGGGVQALYEIFSTPGASASVMSAGVPYSRAALLKFLNPAKDADSISFCSKHTTVMMADRARQATAALFMAERRMCAVSKCNLFGVGCTASLRTSKAKQGDHRCFVSVSSDRGVSTYSLTLQKGARTREEEDRVCSQLIFQAIADACDQPILQADVAEKMGLTAPGAAVFISPPRSPLSQDAANTVPPLSRQRRTFSDDGEGRPKMSSVTRLFEKDIDVGDLRYHFVPPVHGDQECSVTPTSRTEHAGEAEAEIDAEAGSPAPRTLVPMLPGDKLRRNLNIPRQNPIASVLRHRSRTATFLPHTIDDFIQACQDARVKAAQADRTHMQNAGGSAVLGGSKADNFQGMHSSSGTASGAAARIGLEPLFVYPQNDGLAYRNESGLAAVKVKCFLDTPLPEGSLVYSGSFNPLHLGHIRLAMAAQRAIVASRASGRGLACSSQLLQGHTPHGTPLMKPTIVFEISAMNADKPPLSLEELEKRLAQFSPSNPLLQKAGLSEDDYAVCISSEPLFLGKAQLFPNCSLCMGVDTLRRLLDKKYYSGCDYEMVAALATIQGQGIDIFVGGRKDTSTGKFLMMTDIFSADGPAPRLPIKVHGMFHEIAEKDFRVDVSSTDLRSRPASTGTASS